MPIVSIVIQQFPPGIDTTPGAISTDELELNIPVVLKNNPPGDIGVTSWYWSFIDKPETSNAFLVTPTQAISGFTPDVPGTYLIQLSINGNAQRAIVGAAVKTLNLHYRIPATREEQEFDNGNFLTPNGWGPAVKNALQFIDDGYGFLLSSFINVTVPPTRILTAGYGLVGGGDLSADRSFALDLFGTAGSYNNVIVDGYGRISSGSFINYALDSAVVHLTGNESIGGFKTFTDTLFANDGIDRSFAGQLRIGTVLTTSGQIGNDVYGSFFWDSNSGGFARIQGPDPINNYVETTIGQSTMGYGDNIVFVNDSGAGMAFGIDGYVSTVGTQGFKVSDSSGVGLLITDVSIDRTNPGMFNLGSAVATSINIGHTGITTAINGDFTVDGYQINPSGAITNQVLQYNGSSFIAADSVGGVVLWKQNEQTWAEILPTIQSTVAQHKQAIVYLDDDNTQTPFILDTPADLDNVHLIGLASYGQQIIHFVPGFTLLGSRLHLQNIFALSQTTILTYDGYNAIDWRFVMSALQVDTGAPPVAILGTQLNYVLLDQTGQLLGDLTNDGYVFGLQQDAGLNIWTYSQSTLDGLAVGRVNGATGTYLFFAADATCEISFDDNPLQAGITLYKINIGNSKFLPYTPPTGYLNNPQPDNVHDTFDRVFSSYGPQISVVPGTYNNITVDAYGRTTSGSFVSLSNNTPLPLYADAYAGIGTEPSRWDHKHKAAAADGYFDFYPASPFPSVSNAGEARITNSLSGLLVSQSGADYKYLVIDGLQGAYVNATLASQNEISLTNEFGPVIIHDTSASLTYQFRIKNSSNDPLFDVSYSLGSTFYSSLGVVGGVFTTSIRSTNGLDATDTEIGYDAETIIISGGKGGKGNAVQSLPGYRGADLKLFAGDAGDPDGFGTVDGSDVYLDAGSGLGIAENGKIYIGTQVAVSGSIGSDGYGNFYWNKTDQFAGIQGPAPIYNYIEAGLTQTNIVFAGNSFYVDDISSGMIHGDGYYAVLQSDGFKVTTLPTSQGLSITDVSIDRTIGGQFNLGTTTATSINIGRSGVTTALAGTVTIDGYQLNPSGSISGEALVYNGSAYIPQNISVQRSSTSDFELVDTSAHTIVSFTPAISGNFMIPIYFRVITASTTLDITITWTDGSGAQTITPVSGSQIIGSYTMTPLYINATTSAITVTATAGTGNQVFVSSTITGV